MTEEEQLRAAMMASMGGDPSSAIEIPQEDENEVTPEPTKGITIFFFVFAVGLVDWQVESPEFKLNVYCVSLRFVRTYSCARRSVCLR